MSISAEEFATLQMQMLELKQWKYEMQEREKKLLQELKAVKDQSEKTENELKKANNVISKSKDRKEFAHLLEENENMMRNLQLATQEHRDQQEAVLQNMKTMYSTNKTLEEEVERLKTEAAKNSKLLDDQQLASLKLQVRNVELETTGAAPTPRENPEGDQQNGDGTENSHVDEERERLRLTVQALGNRMKLLEERLEKTGEEHTATVTELESQLAAAREKAKQDSIAGARREETMSQEINKLQEDLGSVLVGKESHVTHISTLEATVQELKQSNAHLTEELNNEKASKDEINEKLQNLEEFCDNYKIEMKELFMKCQSLESSLNEQTSNNSALTTANKDLDTKLKFLTEEKNELETRSITFQYEQEKKLERLQADAAAKLEAVQSGAAAKLEQVQQEAAAKFEKAQSEYNAYFEKARNEHAAKQAKALADHTEQLQTVQNELTAKLEYVQSTLTAELEAARAEHTEKHTDLQKEHGDAVQQLDETKSKLDELTSRADKLHSDLTIAEAEVIRLTAELEETQKARDEFSTEKETLRTKLAALEEEYKNYKTEAEAKISDTEALQTQLEEALVRANAAETLVTDKETELKIVERKNQRMIKELKSELHKERTATPSKLMQTESLNVSSSNLLTSSATVPSSPAVQTTPAPLTRSNSFQSAPTTPLAPRNLGLERAYSTPPQPATPAAQATTNEVLRTDLETLAKKVGELGTEKWKLEEKIRFLEENIGLLNEELQKKSQVVQYYISKSNPNIDHNANKNKAGAVGAFFRASDPALAAELLAKMEAVLEETVLKNIQLQNDIVTMANELTRLEKARDAK